MNACAADAERIFENETEGLLLTAEAAFGAFVIRLRQRCAFFQQLGDAFALQRYREHEAENGGADDDEACELQAFDVAFGRVEVDVAVNRECNGGCSPRAAREAEQDRERDQRCGRQRQKPAVKRAHQPQVQCRQQSWDQKWPENVRIFEGASGPAVARQEFEGAWKNIEIANNAQYGARRCVAVKYAFTIRRVWDSGFFATKPANRKQAP